MHSLPFKVDIQPGKPAYEQVVLAVHHALATGLLKTGDSFPSVRKLSKEVRINPNTAHKVVQQLVSEGILEVLSGRGTRIAPSSTLPLKQRLAMIAPALDPLVVEAMRLGFQRKELMLAIEQAWQQLTDTPSS